MTPTISPQYPLGRRSPRREGAISQRSARASLHHARGSQEEHRPLGRYSDSTGRLREVVVRDGSAGSRLILDRDAVTLGDRRLVAHLAADEPSSNAALVCQRYLEETPGRRRRCRAVTREDFESAPFPDGNAGEWESPIAPSQLEALDRHGARYRLEQLASEGMSIPELRWRRYSPGASEAPRLVSVREAIASLESYEPIRATTLEALARHRDDYDVSTTILRAELARVQESPIVLNRRLRQAALAIVDRQGLSMSEIAIRCGRVKRDSKGNESGETSWLARRLGILPEGGTDTPTPWIHSDVLALIARSGLGISPHEVELG
jgi:hypothetical protein